MLFTVRSLQRSLTPTGGGSGQEYAGPGQWQQERLFKSGSNQLLIINTVSRVIWCFVFFVQTVAFVPWSHPHHRKQCFRPFEKIGMDIVAIWTSFLGGTSGQLRSSRRQACGKNVNNPIEI